MLCSLSPSLLKRVGGEAGGLWEEEEEVGASENFDGFGDCGGGGG